MGIILKFCQVLCFIETYLHVVYAKVFPNCGPWWFTVPCTHLLPSACWPTRWSTLFPHRMMGILFSDTSWPSNKYIWSLDRKITSELAHVYALDPVSDWGEGPLAGHVVQQHHAVRPPAVRVFNLDINVHIHKVQRRRLLSCTQKINYDDIIVVNIISKSKLESCTWSMSWWRSGTSPGPRCPTAGWRCCGHLRGSSSPVIGQSHCVTMQSSDWSITWKSTPNVELRLDMKTPLVILLMKEVLPTAASPANTTLRR